MKSWKAWALVAVIFASGVLAGAFGMRAYMIRHLPDVLAQTRKRLEERILEDVDREVGLSEQQKQAIQPILQEAVAKGEKIHQAVREQIDPIMREMDERVAAQLNPGQRERFKEFLDRMERMRREGRPPGPPGGPQGGPQGGPGGPPPPGGPGFPPPPAPGQPAK
jgi:hypothetical protein